MPEKKVEELKTSVKKGNFKSWEDIHTFYSVQGEQYTQYRLQHAFASLLESLDIDPASFDKSSFAESLMHLIKIKEQLTQGIFKSREKDYTNPFRKMVYENNKEMEKVLGKLEDNSFIKQQNEVLRQLKKNVKDVMKNFRL